MVRKSICYSVNQLATGPDYFILWSSWGRAAGTGGRDGSQPWMTLEQERGWVTGNVWVSSRTSWSFYIFSSVYTEPEFGSFLEIVTQCLTSRLSLLNLLYLSWNKEGIAAWDEVRWYLRVAILSLKLGPYVFKVNGWENKCLVSVVCTLRAPIVRHALLG